MHDHELSFYQTDDTVWITVGDKIVVRVMQTDEGALCDMYDASLIENDGDEAHMAACYAFFSEAGTEDEVPDLEPTHYNCCHAPKDMGHMFGCPNSPENNKGSD